MSKKKQEEPEDSDGTKGGGRKLLIMGLVAVLAIGAAAYFFVFSGSGEAEAEPAAEAGSVVLAVEPVAINLAGGSYLKIGFTLQFSLAYDEATAGGSGHTGGATPDGSKAMDIAISQFSGAALSDVQTNREAMKAAFEAAVIEAYHGDVYELWYTEYVTQ